MRTQVAKRIGIVLCFMSILLFGANRLEAGNFDKCHKKFKKQDKKCTSLVKKMGKLQSGMDKITSQIQKLIKKKDKVNQDAMAESKKAKAIKKIRKQVESKIDTKRSKTDLFMTTIKNYDKCKDDAQQILIDCRLEKKSFNTGCNEKKLDKKLKEIYARLDGADDEHLECNDGCITQYFGERETYEKVGNEVRQKKQTKGILVQTLNKYSKCLKGCFSAFKGNKSKFQEWAKKQRVKIYKKCLKLSELDL